MSADLQGFKIFSCVSFCRRLEDMLFQSKVRKKEKKKVKNEGKKKGRKREDEGSGEQRVCKNPQGESWAQM